MKKLLLLLVIIFIGLFFYINIPDANLNSKPISQPKKTQKPDYSAYLFGKFYDQAIAIVDKMPLEEQVGQIFLVRYNKETVESESSYYPGGYILFAKDIENHTKESLTQELANNQKLSKYPLIFAVDEEGGTVTRISRFQNFRSEKFPSPQTIYKEGGYDLLEKIETEKANLLLSLGINLNLAPVADISTNESDFIYDRSFGQDASKTAEYIKNMVTYSNKNNINSCLKHFPGYGNNKDTHDGIVYDYRPYENFLTSDFLPFQAGIAAGVPCILVSHNITYAMDETFPASLSKKVNFELRTTLNFSGIIITDDLAMGAISKKYNINEAATLALQAGNDMLLTSDFINMYNIILSNVKDGIIDKELLKTAVTRIIAWKYYSNLF